MTAPALLPRAAPVAARADASPGRGVGTVPGRGVRPCDARGRTGSFRQAARYRRGRRRPFLATNFPGFSHT